MGSALPALGIGLAAIAAAPAAAADRPPIAGQRAEEDWRAWCARNPGSEPLKCIGRAPLQLSLGGDLRERVELVRNPAFGLAAVDSDSVLLHRLLLHADLRAGDHVRLFAQLANLAATDRATAQPPTDRNRLGLQQGFLELSAPLGAARLSLRAGRQEVALGSQRLVTVREGPNARLAFDGARLGLAQGSWRLDGLLLRAVQPAPGLFDDDSDGPRLWGLYATRSQPPGTGTGLDLYWLGYSRPRARFDRATAPELRHTLGLRLFGRRGPLDWDWEAAWQGGHFGDQRIRGWTVATVTALSPPGAALAPRIGLSVNIASGDRRNGDDSLNTFNPLFPRAPYFTEAAINAPANLVDFDPFIELRPAKGLVLRASHDMLWRASRDDAFYTMPLVPLIPGNRSDALRTGSQTELRVNWQAGRHLGFAGSIVHFQAGPFVRESGGRSQQFLMFSSTARF